MVITFDEEEIRTIISRHMQEKLGVLSGSIEFFDEDGKLVYPARAEVKVESDGGVPKGPYRSPAGPG